MKNFNAYESLLKLRPYEEIAYSFYMETGKYLNTTELYFLMKSQDNRDFSRLDSIEYTNFAKKFDKAHRKNDFMHMPSDMQIPDYADISVTQLLRFTDILEHRHDFFEIMCILKGRCHLTVNGKEVFLRKGDVTIIPPRAGHRLLPDPETLGLVIEVRTDFFENVLSSLLRQGTTLAAFFSNSLYSKQPCNIVTFHCESDAFIYETLMYMYAQQSVKKHHYANVLDGLLLTLLSYLLQNYEEDIEFADESNSFEGRVIAIEKYLRQNFKTATLAETAEHFDLNPAYFSALIKKKTGYNFAYFLRHFRMERAADLLQRTDMKIEQICEAVGYCDTTQFIKTFKKQYGETPSSYRKNCRNTIKP